MTKSKEPREKLFDEPKYIGLKIEMATYLKLRAEAEKQRSGFSHLVRNILNDYEEKII